MGVLPLILFVMATPQPSHSAHDNVVHVSIEYSVPQECPSEQQFIQSIEAHGVQLHRVSAGKNTPEILLAAAKSGSLNLDTQWEARLSISSESAHASRKFERGQCVDAVNAAAFAIAEFLLGPSTHDQDTVQKIKPWAWFGGVGLGISNGVGPHASPAFQLEMGGHQDPPAVFRGAFAAALRYSGQYAVVVGTARMTLQRVTAHFSSCFIGHGFGKRRQVTLDGCLGVEAGVHWSNLVESKTQTNALPSVALLAEVRLGYQMTTKLSIVLSGSIGPQIVRPVYSSASRIIFTSPWVVGSGFFSLFYRFG